MARRLATITTALLVFVLASASTALACGGLIGPRGSVNLIKTTTLAAYHAGVEHYVTSFTFTGGGGGKFGSLVPLPGVPSNVERGGKWTLQRLVQEVTPPPAVESFAVTSQALGADSRATVLIETKIDALDITVLKGGARSIAEWATENGFVLPPDSPEVLEFYARRSPIFMAARFDAAAAARLGQLAGDGTPIHLTIPTPNPWVPLRILALGKADVEPVEADVFLLTDREPALLPRPENARGAGQIDAGQIGTGLIVERSVRASSSLLADLRSDDGMDWLPAEDMWLSYITLAAPASEVTWDLAIDASGFEQPSPVAAGLAEALESVSDAAPAIWPVSIVMLALAALAALARRRPQPSA